jgi:hypothetical protein
VTEDVFLRFVKSGYALYVCGKTGTVVLAWLHYVAPPSWLCLAFQSLREGLFIGEAIANRHVMLSLDHCLSNRAVKVNLMSDSNGLVALGAMEDIVSIAATLMNDNNRQIVERTWELTTTTQSRCNTLNAVVGQAVQVPVTQELPTLSLSEVSLTKVDAQDGYALYLRHVWVCLAGVRLEYV